jgi:Txe/YoeB family toxin of Txe-Axe toxin-antitoxin module
MVTAKDRGNKEKELGAEMSINEKTVRIAFADERVKKAYEKLKSGRSEEKQLLAFIERAIEDLKIDPFCGITVPSKQWPSEYVKKYGVDNLIKYDLPNGWRLIYTVRGNEVEIISILIEWLDHKNYDRKFKYNTG